MYAQYEKVDPLPTLGHGGGVAGFTKEISSVEKRIEVKKSQYVNTRMHFGNRDQSGGAKANSLSPMRATRKLTATENHGIQGSGSMKWGQASCIIEKEV